MGLIFKVGFWRKTKGRDLHFGGRRRVEKIFKVAKLSGLIFKIMEKKLSFRLLGSFFFFLAEIFGLKIVFFLKKMLMCNNVKALKKVNISQWIFFFFFLRR